MKTKERIKDILTPIFRLIALFLAYNVCLALNYFLISALTKIIDKILYFLTKTPDIISSFFHPLTCWAHSNLIILLFVYFIVFFIFLIGYSCVSINKDFKVEGEY